MPLGLAALLPKADAAVIRDAPPSQTPMGIGIGVGVVIVAGVGLAVAGRQWEKTRRAQVMAANAGPPAPQELMPMPPTTPPLPPGVNPDGLPHMPLHVHGA